MTPRMADRVWRRLTVPELSGGVNLRDGISQVEDNQLTACENVWYKNGMLQTRPGLKCTGDDAFITDYYDSSDPPIIYTDRENLKVEGGVTYFLAVVRYREQIVFRYYYGEGQYVNAAVITDTPKGDFGCNVFMRDDEIYCICSGYYPEEELPFYIFKIAKEGSGGAFWEGMTVKRLREEDFYAPIVAVNLSAYSNKTALSEQEMLYGAAMPEGFNLLGNRFRIYASTVDRESLKAGGVEQTEDPAHYMVYAIPYAGKSDRVFSLIPSILQVKITYSWGEAIHTVSVKQSESLYTEEECNADNLKMEVERRSDGGITLKFFEGDSRSLCQYVTEDDYILNNMEIIAPCENGRTGYEKILNMTRSVWYGGESKGLYGGVRLFLGGNTTDSEKALICWADIKSSLYFSENCYAYVGDKSQRVTAFGRQGESLIIFKEREVYATEYTGATDAINADTVISGATVDVTAAEAVFPLVQVHGLIGCDCPETVQLCRNRLVWLHSDGAVYTLLSPNGYSERSIYEISAMVGDELKRSAKEELLKAVSADWQGHYLLGIGEKLYLTDYNSYGYANIASYTKTEDAQLHIPWWIWTTPHYLKNETYTGGVRTSEERIKVFSAVTVGERLYLWSCVRTDAVRGDVLREYLIPELFYFEQGTDRVPDIRFETDPTTSIQWRLKEVRERRISAVIQTKLFDFGDPTSEKTVPKTVISFGNNGGVPITVAVLTDKGESERTVVQCGSETDRRNAGFFKNTVIQSPQKPICRVGFKLTSTGGIYVDALRIAYRFMI